MSELKPRTASVVVYQGDDIERLSELHRKAQTARRTAEAAFGTPLRTGDAVAPKGALVAEEVAYNEAVSEAADRAIVIEVEALKRARFRSLLAEHPPRETDEDDKAYGVNVDSFGQPFLVESVTRAGVGERDFTPGQTRDLIEDLPEGDFDRLFATAYWLNRAPGADPKESTFSAALPTSPVI